MNLENIDKSERYIPSVEQERRLSLLENLVIALEAEQIRYSIMGGYGLDGLYGELTRDHDDIDMLLADDDLEKVDVLLKNLNFEVKEDKDTGVKVYFDTTTQTKLEIGNLKLLQNYTQADSELFLPIELNASLGNVSFRTASIEGHRIIQGIQGERAKKLGWGENPHEASTEKLMHQIEEKITP